MSNPVDEKMYKRISEIIKLKYPINSAYRSGLIVKKYKQEFYEKYGPFKEPYISTDPIISKGGLKRWFAEEWRNQRGDIGYSQKRDIYRPTIKINKDTPKTFGELSQKEINRASDQKIRLGRVKKF